MSNMDVQAPRTFHLSLKANVRNSRITIEMAETSDTFTTQRWRNSSNIDATTLAKIFVVQNIRGSNG